jgi:hypothetical protein
MAIWNSGVKGETGAVSVLGRPTACGHTWVRLGRSETILPNWSLTLVFKLLFGQLRRVSVADGVGASRVRARVSARALLADRVSSALCAIFLGRAAFYVWISASALPLALTGGTADAYNQLASAFLHLRLSVGRARIGKSETVLLI